MVEKIWGDLISVSANCGIMKELVDGGMNNEVWHISEHERAINMMKENKATHESGMRTEYLKSLGEPDVQTLRLLLN